MTKRFFSMALMLVALAPNAHAVDPIAVVETVRSGDDLSIRWDAVAGPIDGYRVYRYRDLRCLTPELVYEGPAGTLSFTDVAALADDVWAMYRVAAYDAVGNGPLTTPLYEFASELSARERNVSVPYWTGASDASDLCVELGADVELRHVRTTTGTPIGLISYACISPPVVAFDLPPGMSLALSTTFETANAKFHGHGHPVWSTALTERTWFASLPIDHSYYDLRQLAEDIPTATSIELLVDPADSDVTGLSRADSALPWTGTNVRLGDHFAKGLYVKVDIPVLWEPRRLCGATCSTPRRVVPLFATKSSLDVALEWTPRPIVDGAYNLYRVTDKALIPGVKTAPVHLVEPVAGLTFPVTDAGAVPETAGSLLYYQVVAGCASGSLGDL